MLLGLEGAGGLMVGVHSSRFQYGVTPHGFLNGENDDKLVDGMRLLSDKAIWMCENVKAL